MRARSDGGGGPYTMNYTHDKRGRLTQEGGALPPVPVGEGGSGQPTPVNLIYTYDQVGNRLTKSDGSVVPAKVTTYFYDVHDPDWDDAGHAQTFNNRLLRTETVQGAAMLERVWYAYHRAGHVKRTVRNEPSGLNPNGYALTCMYYDGDQHLWLIRSVETEKDPVSGETTCELPVYAREFRYDGGGRRRYLSRDRDPSTLAPLAGGQSWREYLGKSIYADLSVNPTNGDSIISRRYVHARDGRLLGWREGTNWHFVHADHLGSTRLVTMPNASVGSRMGYSAFGEVLSFGNSGGAAARSRYGYCGGWGYENDGLADPAKELRMLHIGARYFSQTSGSFVQRDPFGIIGGLNVYAYARSSPNALIDSRGTESVASIVSTAAVGQVLQAIALGGAAFAAGYAADRLATFIWTTNVGYAADMLGISPQDMRNAIHAIKDACKVLGGADQIEIDTETGDVRIRGTEEDIGNVGDEIF